MDDMTYDHYFTLNELSSSPYFLVASLGSLIMKSRWREV